MYINVKEAKKKLRTQFKKKRENIVDTDKAEKDDRILKRLLELWSFRDSDTIFTYVSTPTEVDTKALILAALAMGKKVAVPYCIDNTAQMDFYYITDYENDLTPRTFGVLEPLPLRCKRVEKTMDGVCIVPGLAYAADGYRLGYGKGYYDRFLSGYSGVTIGLVYADCVVQKLPHGRYDQSVDILITEKYVKPTSVLQ